MFQLSLCGWHGRWPSHGQRLLTVQAPSRTAGLPRPLEVKPAIILKKWCHINRYHRSSVWEFVCFIIPQLFPLRRINLCTVISLVMQGQELLYNMYALVIENVNHSVTFCKRPWQGQHRPPRANSLENRLDFRGLWKWSPGIILEKHCRVNRYMWSSLREIEKF